MPSFPPAPLRGCRVAAGPPHRPQRHSACRFWLTLSVIRRSSSSGAEDAAPVPLRRRPAGGPAPASGPATSLRIQVPRHRLAVTAMPRSSRPGAAPGRHTAPDPRCPVRRSSPAIAQRNRAPELQVADCPARDRSGCAARRPPPRCERGCRCGKTPAADSSVRSAGRLRALPADIVQREALSLIVSAETGAPSSDSGSSTAQPAA